MEAIFRCDGLLWTESIVDQQKISPPEGGRDADRGTMIHKHVETGDVSDLDPDDADEVVRIRETEERLVSDWIAATGHTLSDVTVYRELRVWVPGYYSGQGDTIVINFQNNTALITDTKTGRRPVPPPVRNWQLRAVANAVHLQYKVAPIRTTIIQPHAKEMPFCDYTVDHLKTIDQRIRERLDFVRTPGLKRTAGDWCKYCRAQHICPEAKASLSVIIRNQNRLNWDMLQPADKLQLYKAAVMAEDCVKMIKGMIQKELAQNPEAIPGLVKAKDQEPRSIDNPREFVIAFIDFLIGQNQNLEDIDARKLRMALDMFSITKLSFGSVADFVRQIQGCTKSQAEALLANSFAEFISKGFRRGKIDIVKEEEK